MNANTNDKDRQAKKTVQSRFDEFRKWSPNDVEKRFGTTPRRYIDQAEVKSVLDLLDLDQTHETLALDAGCGSGRFLIPLSKDLNIFGVDFSKGLLEKAKKESPRVSLCVADLEHLPFGTETFDTVLCIRVLQHVTDQKEAIRELSRITKKGGILVILAYNNLTLHAFYKWFRQKFKNWKWYPDNYCSPWELKKMLSRTGVSVVKIRGIVMANPWFFNYFNLTQLLQRTFPRAFNYYFKTFQKLDEKLGNRFPFRYLSDRTIMRGVKVDTF